MTTSRRVSWHARAIVTSGGGAEGAGQGRGGGSLRTCAAAAGRYTVLYCNAYKQSAVTCQPVN